MLHGCGQDADDFACGTGMNSLAEKYHCLAAYPEQSCGVNGAKCWNWFEEAHHHCGQGEPALIAGVAQKIISEYAVDAGKVFVAGLSSGGSMAVILGRTYPDLFTAVGCHSGLAHGAATDRLGAMQAMRHGADVEALDGMAAADGVPIIVFHGDLDSTVHPRNGGRVVRQSLQARAATQTHAQEVGEATGAHSPATSIAANRATSLPNIGPSMAPDTPGPGAVGAAATLTPTAPTPASRCFVSSFSANPPERSIKMRAVAVLQ